MHPIQIAKAYGWLPQVGLDKLADNETKEQYYLANVNHLLNDERCGHPDKPDPEIADKTTEEQHVLLSQRLGMSVDEAGYLQNLHQNFLNSIAAGRGSWPTHCHPDLYDHENRHAVTYFIREDSFSRNWTRNASDDEIRHLAKTRAWGPEESVMDSFTGKRCLDIIPWFLEESYRRINVKLLRVDEERKADIVALGRVIPGGTIGLGWFPSGHCNDVVQSHYDNSWGAPLYNQVRLFLHEFGHNHRLAHEFSRQGWHKSIMSYTNPGNCWGFYKKGLVDPDPLPDDASLPELREFFGDGEIPSDTPPTPGEVELILKQGQPIEGFFTPFRGYTVLPDGRIAFIASDGSKIEIRHVS